MKLDRLLAIIVYLLNHEKVKAQELADKFEVSVRTIYRDIDAISLAGIPIVTYQGTDGGIGIAENGFPVYWRPDKTRFNHSECCKKPQFKTYRKRNIFCEKSMGHSKRKFG